MPAMQPKVRDDLNSIVIQGESVVYDDATGEAHLLNPAATVVFQLCDGTATVKELATDIAEAYGLPLDDVQRDVRTVIREFRKMGLIESPGAIVQEDTTSQAPTKQAPDRSGAG